MRVPVDVHRRIDRPALTISFAGVLVATGSGLALGLNGTGRCGRKPDRRCRVVCGARDRSHGPCVPRHRRLDHRPRSATRCSRRAVLQDIRLSEGFPTSGRVSALCWSSRADAARCIGKRSGGACPRRRRRRGAEPAMTAPCAETTLATDVRGFFAQQIYAAAMRVVPNIAPGVRRTARPSSPPLKGKLSIDARGEVWIKVGHRNS